MKFGFGVGTYLILANKSTRRALPKPSIIEGYRDGYVTTSPVGSYPALRNGILALSGHVWEGCEDWYDKTNTACVLRGGSWRSYYPVILISSGRSRLEPGERDGKVGFRVVLAGDEFAPPGGL